MNKTFVTAGRARRPRRGRGERLRRPAVREADLKLPHLGMTSCLISRTFATPHDSADLAGREAAGYCGLTVKVPPTEASLCTVAKCAITRFPKPAGFRAWRGWEEGR